VSGPETLAGRALVDLVRGLDQEAIVEVERQARGRQAQDDAARRERVLDRIRHLLSSEQLAAANAVLLLDPDSIAALPDEQVRFVLAGLASSPSLGPEARAASREAARRYLDKVK
jgi:hypothetical protein